MTEITIIVIGQWRTDINIKKNIKMIIEITLQLFLWTCFIHSYKTKFL